MVWRGPVPLRGAPLVALLGALLLSGGPVMAGDPGCSASVEPASAVGGSIFTFTGTGFKPTRLMLDLVSDQPSSSLPALLYLMVAGFGLTGGAFLSRRLGAARYGSKP